jgi:hypothetical protein
MDDSILLSTKKVLGISPDDDTFDQDILIYINSALSVLQTEGTGLLYSISDETAKWSDFVTDQEQINLVRTIVYLRVRMLFDPPINSFTVGAMERQIAEHEWRLNVLREDVQWVDPNPPPIVEEVL